MTRNRDKLLADISRLRDELNATLDELVATERATPNGNLLPEAAHRGLLTRNETCLCSAMTRLLEKETEAAA